MSGKARCRETVMDCINKMTENMNRIIEHSQISTLEGTAYDSFLSSFSMKIQVNKICCQSIQQVVAEITLSNILNDPKIKYDMVENYKKDYINKKLIIDNYKV
ncbi:hypothetical protein FG386_000561 [Cryptosporidium ryanae]|uniref:uncharacterized protein n=1 Tax=Cryptosporidium ryanae TaxID=515981 RepID=UPI00351A7377|nr:hypothetical protein FG386_000561 [Cryptosporidium ryanae]